ncbi:hypothetical protein BAE44_0009969 [Dichanthelium oligosanthes]|uniref:DNA2/NAM7 helicase-like C-terminal domain-containing protein n=1 Tax=Dichanthelium oligosanthes TaxID=888268 RepID=A0A1E5VV98_9POAL|nr:hypothetical protein BAE44_0009969 [Dichanthelium oligosanthes]
MPGLMEEAEELSDVVEKIPHAFDSLDNYFKSFIAPLVEETRSQLCTSLQVICEAPYSEIISMEAVGDSQLLCSAPERIKGQVISIISAVRCKHLNLVKLIWGPPGTGKTKTYMGSTGHREDKNSLKEAGFGVSLFKRLAMLGFKKHILNMQYRMNPCISLFPNAWFYDGMITDGSNVKSLSYNKDYLDLPFGASTFLNIVDGKEEREISGSSWRIMVEVAVVLQLIKSIFKCMYLGPYVLLLFIPSCDAS